MCRDGDCPVIDEPPPGEAWCQYRLGLEYARWVFGYPMEPGAPEVVALTGRRASADRTVPVASARDRAVGGGWGI